MSEHTPGRRVSDAEFEAAIDQMASGGFFDDWLAFVDLIRGDRAAILAINADLLVALEEWRDAPYFETFAEWLAWVAEFRPRVEAAIAKARGEA